MALSSRSFRTLVTLCLVTRPDAVWPPAQILGKGWDLTNSNFWEYAESFHANMFSHRMPPRSCFTDTRCLHVSSQLHQSFKSVQEWERYCTRTLGLQRDHDPVVHVDPVPVVLQVPADLPLRQRVLAQ